MSEPLDDHYKDPYTGNVSIRQVLIYDLTSFLTFLIFLFVITCTASIYIGVKWLEFPPPRESPGEILLGIMGITAVAASIIRYRISRISKILNQGSIVTAQVVRGLAYQFFVQIQVMYTHDSDLVNTILWLPNTRGPRTISRLKQLILSIETLPKGTIIIRNLYL